MTKTNEQSLIGLAREKWEEENGNHERTVHAVIRAIESDHSLYKAIADEAIHVAAREVVNRIRYNDRHTIISMHSARQEASTILGHRQTAMSALMDYPVGNTRLGDTTRKDLENNIELRDKSILSYQIETEWLRRIAKELKAPGSKVKNELVEADLQRIRRRAEKAFEVESHAS